MKSISPPKESPMRRTLSFARITGALPIAVVSFIAVAMLAARIAYSQRITYVFLAWNLFLAWIPFVLSLPFDRARNALAFGDAPSPSPTLRSGDRDVDRGRPLLRPLALALLALVWLAFLPNAPYLVTDFVHLHARPGVPIAYDATMLFAFAGAGFLSMSASLAAVQSAVARRFGERSGWLFAMAVLALCGVGMYVGRVLRWNSWDVVTRPDELARITWSAALDPVGHARALALSMACAIVSLAAYSVTRVCFDGILRGRIAGTASGGRS